jgi:hypothetical protein
MKRNLLLLLFVIFIQISTVLAQKPGSYNAVEFDGSDDYINIPDISALNPSAKITVEAWIRADFYGSTSFANSILCKHGWASGNKGYVLRCGDNGKLSFNIANASGTWIEAVSGAVMKTGIWYHVAGMFTGDSINVYINGNLEGTTLYTGSISPSTGLNPKIGDLAYSVGGTRLFKGQIDEVRVWETSLSKAEIRDWMCRKVTASHPQYKKLAGYWKLDESSGVTAYDKSANANNATLTNGPIWVSSGAAIGDTSVHIYGGKSLSLTSTYGDVFGVKNINGSPSYVHAYLNYDTTGQGLGKNVVGSLDSTHYFGVYHDENKSVNFDINYNFANLKKAKGDKKCGVNMLSKTNGNTGLWSYASGKLYNNADSLAVYNQAKGEFVMSLYETDSNKLISVLGANPWLCESDSILLGASSNDSFQFAWYRDGNLWPGKNKRTQFVGSIGRYKVQLQRKGTTCTFMSKTIQITDKRPTVSWSYTLNTCENSDSIKLPEGTPTGGTFSGKKVSAGGYFYPKLVGAGKHVLYYLVTTVDGCTSKASSTVTLIDTSKLTVTPISAICPESDPFLLKNITPSGGVYTGNGVVSNTFYPANAGNGKQAISYTFTNGKACSSKTSFDIEIYTPDSISVSTKASACQNEVPFLISVYPNGGTITCPAVVGQTFYPTFASVGYTKVLYTINDQHDCKVVDSTFVYIAENPKVNIAPFARVCDNEKAITLSGATPADSGKYYVNNVIATTFDPAFYGKGLYTVEYRVVNYFGCRDSASTKIRVNESPVKPVVTISGDDLVSNAPKGNQWFDKNGVIAGQKLNVYTPYKRWLLLC